MNKIVIGIVALAFLASCKSQKETTEPTYYPADGNVDKQDRGGERGQRPGGPPSIDQIFEMDADADGFLSKSEVKGPLERDFDSIDTDGNGLLSKEEVQNAPRPQRGQKRGRN